MTLATGAGSSLSALVIAGIPGTGNRPRSTQLHEHKCQRYHYLKPKPVSMLMQYSEKGYRIGVYSLHGIIVKQEHFHVTPKTSLGLFKLKMHIF